MSKQRYYQPPAAVPPPAPSFYEAPVVGYVGHVREDADAGIDDQPIANKPSAEALAAIRKHLDPNTSQYTRSAGRKWNEGEGKNKRILEQVRLAHHVCPHCYGFLAFGKRADMDLEECVDCCSVWQVKFDRLSGEWLFRFRMTSARYDVVRVAVRVARRRAGIE